LLTLAFLIYVFVIPQLGGARDAIDTVAGVSPALIAVGAVLEAGALLAFAQLTRSLLAPPLRPGLGLGFVVALAARGVSNLVPGGAATKAAVNYRLFGLAGVPRPELAFVLSVQAIGSGVVLNLLLWGALVVSIPQTGFHPVYATVAIAGVVLMLLFAGAIIGLLRGRDRLARWVRWAAERIPRLDPHQVDRVLGQFAADLLLLGAQRRRLVTAVGLAAAYWLLDAAALWVFLAAFGHRPGVVGLLVAYGVANVMAVIPVTPGGLGLVEAILIPTLVGFGTPASVAAIGVVAFRLVSFWLPIPLGLASYVVVERHLGGRRDTPDAKPMITALIEQNQDPEATDPAA
jgi:uncharacterized protein (TIRG00374 family)